MSKLKTVDEYISSFPEDRQQILQTIRQAIQEAAPKAEEGISYGIVHLFAKDVFHLFQLSSEKK